MSSETFSKDEFTLLLRAFNSLINNYPPLESVKNELLEIKKQAEQSVELNARQKDGIIARIDNYFNGTYGKTKEGIKFNSESDKSK